MSISKDVIKQCLISKQHEVDEAVIVNRPVEFEENGNYVIVGVRHAGKSYLLYQRVRQLQAAGKGWDEILFVDFEDEDTICKVEGGIMAAGNVSAILDRDDDPEHLLREVMSDFDLKILETTPVEYRCYCSRERVERALISLGKDELESILREQGGCELNCQFCDEVYQFSAEDLEKLLKEI